MIKKNKLTIVSVLAIVVLLMLTACGGHDKDESTGSEGTRSADKNEVVSVETSYGEVEYPIGYEEIVSSEQTTDDNAEEYIFYAVLNGEKIKVYTICFSAEEMSDKGDLIGTTTNEDGDTVNIYLLPEEDIVDDDMSDDDKNLIYAAQETLNDVVSSISNWPDYKPAKS